LAEEIRKELDVKVELKPGEFHSFDVFVDGNLIFSKFKEDRFPEPEEVIELIRPYLELDQH
jgi:selT/selW/selH-like putative selenoprotein